jgi:hypothetical protein
MRSGIDTTLSAVRNSGFFWKRVLFSSVEASSAENLYQPRSRRKLIKCSAALAVLTLVRLLELGLTGEVRHGGGGGGGGGEGRRGW